MPFLPTSGDCERAWTRTKCDSAGAKSPALDWLFRISTKFVYKFSILYIGMRIALSLVRERSLLMFTQIFEELVIKNFVQDTIADWVAHQRLNEATGTRFTGVTLSGVEPTEVYLNCMMSLFPRKSDFRRKP